MVVCLVSDLKRIPISGPSVPATGVWILGPMELVRPVVFIAMLGEIKSVYLIYENTL
jgi:hypothetical protein